MRLNTYMAVGLAAMGVAACNVHHANKATFRIVLDDGPVAIAARALPSSQDHRDEGGGGSPVLGGNTTSGTAAGAGGSGGGSGGGGSGGG
ncbi:MAG: hypothetical protein JWM80_2533, partial [Cyanobacteria bacterium RYN_339]|nr:hypothetical protein [Cyanobacteria bacterium RYN_339]